VADDEVTDLTESEEESGEPAKGKGKKEKEPKAAKEPKEKKAKKQKEKGGTGGIVIIMILVLVILIGGFGAALYFDVFSAREITADLITDPLLDTIIWLNPGYLTIDQRLTAEREAQEKRFAEQEEDLDEREELIKQREDALNSREQQLFSRGLELDRREEQLLAMYERTVPLYRRDNITEDELEDMMSLSRLYSQMSPDDAAERLVRLHDRRDVAAILYFMGERNAASILATMDPNYAAELTEIWLYN